MLNQKLIAPALLGLVMAAALIAGCGDDEETTSSMASVDGAFVVQMTTHHEAAVEMARIAEDQGQHPEIRNLAGDIIKAQEAEIGQMARISQRLESTHSAHHESMGMSDEEMGMTMDPADLEDARPFDRAFIDAMIPHHQGAIRMARAELDRGTDPETRELAESIVEAQAREIEDMNAWRERWYGAPSPAGGVPVADDMEAGDMHDGDGMGH